MGGAGVIDENVQAAEAFRDALDHGHDLGLICDIGFMGDRFGAQGFDLARGRFGVAFGT